MAYRGIPLAPPLVRSGWHVRLAAPANLGEEEVP